jgi:hypothetical protein
MACANLAESDQFLLSIGRRVAAARTFCFEEDLQGFAPLPAPNKQDLSCPPKEQGQKYKPRMDSIVPVLMLFLLILPRLLQP